MRWRAGRAVGDARRGGERAVVGVGWFVGASVGVRPPPAPLPSKPLPSFLHSASLPLAQPFTDHTEQAFCSAKRRSIKTTWYVELLGPLWSVEGRDESWVVSWMTSVGHPSDHRDVAVIHEPAEAPQVIRCGRSSVSARGSIVRSRDNAVSARGSIVRSRDNAVSRWGSIVRSRDSAVSRWGSTVRSRDNAVSARGSVVRSRDSVVSRWSDCDARV
jgi:hypothetical protein